MKPFITDILQNSQSVMGFRMTGSKQHKGKDHNELTKGV